MWTNRMMEQRQHCAASLGSGPGSGLGSRLGRCFGNELAEKSALPHDLRRIALTKKLSSKPGSKATEQCRPARSRNTSAELSDNLTP
jgi:hypothetical protein